MRERSSEHPMNLADAFVGLASRWPERTALIAPGLTLTYPQLAARAAQTHNHEKAMRTPTSTVGCR